MIDMHSHILPGLDDGAADWEQAIAMARHALADGITEMVCTPHWVLGKYDNARETILARFAEFETRLAAERIPLTIHPGAELRIDVSLPERLRAGELLTLNNGSGYLLLELPEEMLPDNLHDFFWGLQIQGFRLILSHVERNPVLREDPQRLFDWVENGILAQITAASLSEGFSAEIAEFARFLLEHRLAQMLVTDTHSLSMRKPQLSEACRAVDELLGPGAATRMVCDTPRCILRGEPLPAVVPLPLEGPRQRKRSALWSFLRKGTA